MKGIKKIAILTSGGDAPGMNNAIRAVVNASFKKGIIPYLVYEGYLGLTKGNFKKITNKKNLNLFINNGGTFIYSARFPEFKEISIRKKAVNKLKKEGIEALVVIGGDGSYMGASKLKEMGIQTIGLPGTIDNDIALTDYTIGFFTAQNSITNAIDQIRDTAESHNRAIIVEVMGRFCGELALTSAISIGAEILSIPERKLKKEEIFKQTKQQIKDGKRSIIILVTENMYDINKLAKELEQKAGIESRTSVLGHLQRGGRPVAQDRILATRMGAFAVERLLKGETGIAVGIRDNKLVTNDIHKVVNGENKIKQDLLNQYDLSK